MSVRGARRWRRAGSIAAAVALLLIAAGWSIFQVSRARCFQFGAPVICHVDFAEPVVALSFDDGPTRAGTNALIAILRAADVKATFFLTGQEMAANPGYARRLIAAGHELGNHSYHHRRMLGLFAAPYADEVARTDALLRREGMAAPRWFRPPYGKKLTGLPAAVAAAGYRTVTWDVEDPPGVTDPHVYAERVVAQARPGSIIPIHAMYRSGETARAAVPLIVDGLRARGFRIVPVGALVAMGTNG